MIRDERVNGKGKHQYRQGKELVNAERRQW